MRSATLFQAVAGWQRRARYRVRQFFRGWRASLTDADRALVTRVLSPAALALFARMPVDAQAHSLRVLHSLQTDGPAPADLAAAALLHDVGKVAATDAGAYLGLWMRGPVVLLEAFAPALLRRLATPQPSHSPRYAIHVQLAHPQIGAAWARAAGCRALTCWLIEHHQDKMTGATIPATSSDSRSAARCDAPRPLPLAPDLLSRLQWADGRN